MAIRKVQRLPASAWNNKEAPSNSSLWTFLVPGRGTQSKAWLGAKSHLTDGGHWSPGGEPSDRRRIDTELSNFLTRKFFFKQGTLRPEGTTNCIIRWPKMVNKKRNSPLYFSEIFELIEHGSQTVHTTCILAVLTVTPLVRVHLKDRPPRQPPFLLIVVSYVNFSLLFFPITRCQNFYHMFLLWRPSQSIPNIPFLLFFKNKLHNNKPNNPLKGGGIFPRRISRKR